MRILVINGSPKGALSVTQQYVRWLEQRFTEHSFERLHLSKRVRKLARDPSALAEVIEQMATADAILWAWPVYYLLVPSQLKRFVELLFDAGAAERLAGVTTTSLSTSVHFFDHTAHEYMQAVCEDLGMRSLTGLSAGMDNLLSEGFRENFADWFEHFVDAVQRRAPVARRFAPLSRSSWTYHPGRSTTAQAQLTQRVLLVSDAEETDLNLAAMERTLTARLGGRVERMAIGDLNLSGGCRGCLRCGWEGTCVYSDGFEETFRERILNADALVFSGAIRDRYLSWRFKQFFDRSFFLGHRPELAGVQVLWLVSGPLQQIASLRQVLEANTQVGRANLVEIVTDEIADDDGLDGLLSEAARRLVRAMESRARRPRQFLGVGGAKVLRDLVYLTTSVFRADDRYYREHGAYDFPQNNLGQRLFDRVLGLAMQLPPIRSRVQRDMRKLMLRPFEKLVGPVDRDS